MSTLFATRREVISNKSGIETLIHGNDILQLSDTQDKQSFGNSHLIEKINMMANELYGENRHKDINLSTKGLFPGLNEISAIQQKDLPKLSDALSPLSILIDTLSDTAVQSSIIELFSFATEGDQEADVRPNEIKTSTDRQKRTLLPEFNPHTAEHIRNVCAAEPEILNTRGVNQGKDLLFHAQRAENPFRMIYDNTDDSPSSTLIAITQALNSYFDIITLGIKPTIGNFIAHILREKYYRNQHDEICMVRNRKLLQAEILMALDVSSLNYKSYRQLQPAKRPQPYNVIPDRPNLSSSRQRILAAVRDEPLLTSSNGIFELNDNGNIIHLQPSKVANEYMTHHPHALDANKIKRRVIIDTEKNSWRYSDDFDTTGLNVIYDEGKVKINYRGNKHLLHKNSHEIYEIPDFENLQQSEYLSVYMEPLSGNWHLSADNGKPVFNDNDLHYIESIAVEKDENYIYSPSKNNNPASYGAAIIYGKVKSDDISHYQWGRYVEMNGKILPVREHITPGYGVRYELYHPDDPSQKARLIKWDGHRWIFENQTAIQVSNELKHFITPAMYDTNINELQLSAADRYGLCHDSEGHAYLKMDSKFINIKPSNGNRFLLLDKYKNPCIAIRYKNNQFHSESWLEYKNELKKDDLFNKNFSTLEALKRIEGFSEESAKTLLDKYNFPKWGFSCDLAFVADIKAHRVIPVWARNF